MKGLFQCPPWARSFCPFRACGAYMIVSALYLSHLPVTVGSGSVGKTCESSARYIPIYLGENSTWGDTFCETSELN